MSIAISNMIARPARPWRLARPSLSAVLLIGPDRCRAARLATTGRGARTGIRTIGAEVQAILAHNSASPIIKARPAASQEQKQRSHPDHRRRWSGWLLCF